MKYYLKFLAGMLTGLAGVLGPRSYIQYKHDHMTAWRRVSSSRKIAETPAGRVVYGTWGQGPPVLVIHGAGGGFDQALHTAKMFGRDFQWVAPSRFGYLGTPMRKNASPAAQADVYAVLLDSLKIERIPVIALSAGGPSALSFALRHPERCSGLVLVSAVSRAMIDVASNPNVMEKFANIILASEWLVWLGLQLTVHKVVPPLGVPASVVEELNEPDSEWLRTLLEHVLPVQPRRAGMINDFLQIYELDLYPNNQINTPTLILHAQDDSLVSIKHARFAAEIIKDARLVELVHGGHLLLGQRSRVQTEIESFLHQLTDQ